MSPEIGTRALLDHLADAQLDQPLTVGNLLDRFRARAYGMFLLIVVLPVFIPIPIMGAFSGPLVVLVGLQMALLLAHPWLPKRLDNHVIERKSLAKVRDRLDPWLRRLEKISRPRWETLIDHPVAKIFNGLMLIVLGLLLSLPVPLTNYPFGLILLIYCVALIERDGRTQLIAWALGIVEIVVAALLFDQTIAALKALFS